MRPVPLDMLPPELQRGARQANAVPMDMLPPDLGGAPAEEEGFFRKLADVPVGVARGAVSGVRMIADAFGAQNPASQAIRGAEDYLATLMSAQAKNDQAEVSRIWQEAQDKGLGEQVLAGVRAFSVAPVDLISQAFGTVGVNVVGGLAANLGKLALTGTRLGTAGQRATQVATGTTMGAGIAKGEIYESVKNELQAAGATPAQAEKAARDAQRYGGQNMDQILLSAGLGGLAATLGAESVVGRLIAGRGVKPTAGRIAGTAAAEFSTEAAQGAQEQLAKNIALQREGFEVPTERGIGIAGALEGLAGAGVGAGVAAISRPGAPVPKENLPPSIAAPEPAPEPQAAPEAAPRPAPEAEPEEEFPFPAGVEPPSPSEQVDAERLQEITRGTPEAPAAPEAKPQVIDMVEPTQFEAPPEFTISQPVEQPPLPRPAIIEQTEADIQREAQRIQEIEARKPTKSNSLYEFLAYRTKRDTTKDGFAIDNRIDFKELIDIESDRTKTGKIIPSSKLRFIGKEGGRSLSSMIKGQELNPWLREDLWIDGTEDADRMAEKESEAEEYIKDRLRNREYITEDTKNELRNINESLDMLERTLYEVTEEYESDEQRRQAIKDIITEIDAELEFTPPEDFEAPPARPERGAGEPARPARQPIEPTPEEQGLFQEFEEAMQQEAKPTQQPQAEQLQISPEEQKQQALNGFRQALANPVPGFKAKHPSGRVSAIRPKPLNSKQISLLLDLASDAIDLGMPASMLSKVTAAGSTGASGSAAIAPSDGWLMLSKQWASLTKAERTSTLIHELGHTLDWDGEEFGSISRTSRWAESNEELKQWYERDSTTDNPLAYPFSKTFIKKIPDKRPESFAQAFSLYFVAPVKLQTNAPKAYKTIESIVKGVQDESTREAGAAAPTAAGVEVRKARTGKGAEVQPPARTVSVGVSRAGRVRDQRPEVKLRTDNPGGDWLKNKKEDSVESGKNGFGVPRRFGSVTGSLNRTVLVPVDKLARVKGMRGEQMAENIRPKSLESLTEVMSRTGRLPPSDSRDGDYAPFLNIYQDGTPYVNEGNHRIMVAKKLGWQYLPIEIKWFNGAEQVGGEFSPEALLADDARAYAEGFSLDNYGGSAQATTITVGGKKRPTTNSEGRPIHPTTEGIRNFWRWFGDSKVVDDQGRPKVMYHGTRYNIERFKYPISFVSPSTRVANKFAANDMTWSEGKAVDEGANVMPLYVRSDNPFDYSNPDHVKKVAAKVREFAKEGGFDPYRNPRIKKIVADISSGNWTAIEEPLVWDAITDLGFNAAYLEEFGARNIAVFQRQQLKSAIGNIGTFDPSESIALSMSPEDKRRADMELDLFRLTPSGQMAAAAGVQEDMFGAKGELAVPTKLKRQQAQAKEQLSLLEGETKIAPSMKEADERNEYPTRRNIFGQPVKASWGRQNESKLDTFIHVLQDKMIDTKRVIELIRSTGKEITERWNPYLKEELFHGRAAKKTKDFLTFELEPLMQEMRKRDVTMADFEEYLHNRTAKKRNELVARRDPENFPDGGSGILTEDAEAYLNSLDPQRKKDFEALAKMIDQITKGTRDLLVKSGHESKETIEAWEKALPNYVPLNRAEAEYELSNMGTGVGQGYGVRGGFSRAAVGSKRPVVDILANIAMQRERAIVRTEKMRVAQALYGLVLQNPNPNFWLAVDPEAQANPQDIEKITKTLLAMGFNSGSEEVVSLTDLAQAIMEQPTIRKVDPSTNEVVYRANRALIDSRFTVPVRINGADKYIIFNPNDPIAARMAESLRNVDADQMDKVLGPIAKITRYFAAINTQYNPIFGVINFLRDIQGSMLQLTSTPLAGKQKEVVAQTMPALRGIYADLRARRDGKEAKGKWSDLWNQFQDLGGQTGFRDQFSRSEERADALYSVMDPSSWTETKLGKIFTANGTLKVPLETARKSVAKPIFDWLSDYNETMENAIRLAAFKTGLDSGLSPEQAASVAKNLTVNFNRKGLYGKQAGALYAFFNASVQGTARMAQTLLQRKDGKVSLTSAGKKIVYGGLLLGSAQAMLMAAAGFDEDEPPEFIKQRNLVIPMGDGKYATIPYPLGYNIIPTTSRILTEWAMSGFQNPSKRIADLTGAMLEMFNPIGNAGWSWQTFSPTIADIPVALFENRDWTGKPIAKEDFSSLDPTPGYTRARDTASAFSSALSEFLNSASGGTAYQKGIFSPTPDQIDYLIGQLTGGVGREIMKAEQTAKSMVTGEELPTYKIPLVGRFVGDTTGQAASRNRFYNNIMELNGHQREIKGRREAGESVQEYYREHPEARLAKMADTIERNVQRLRKRREDLLEKDAPKEQIKTIENQITVQMERLNEAVKKAKEKK